jgi:hypothetical protein
MPFTFKRDAPRNHDYAYRVLPEVFELIEQAGLALPLEKIAIILEHIDKAQWTRR